MTSSHLLVLASILIAVAGAYAYIRDTLHGHTKPNRMSWCMWALSPLIGAGAAVSAGADMWAIVRIFIAGFLPLLVFLSTFVSRKGYWRTTIFDLLCGAMSLAALVWWLLLSNPVAAVLMAVVSDGIASIPTLIKAWRYPETETVSTYFASFVSIALTLPTIPMWDIPNSAFSLYLLGLNIVLVGCIYRQKIIGAMTL